MDKDQFLLLLKKYQEDNLNEEECEVLENWYNSYGYSEDIKPLENQYKTKSIENRLSKNISGHIQRKNTGRIRQARKWTVAASLLLGSILATYWFFRSNMERTGFASAGDKKPLYDTVLTAIGKMKKIILPDSSEVWLNANSQIHYAPTNFREKRDVFLDKGEAFFAVEENPKSPFQVHTIDLNTQVLGTKFNVKAYPELDYATVHVKTGKVKVTTKQGVLMDTISAGNGLRYDRLKNTWLSDNRFALQAGEWIDGRITLNEATFDELAAVLYNRFQIRLIRAMTLSKNYRYTITILQNKPLEETLRLICAVHRTNYKQHGKTVTIF
ncbi:hypothetical protein GCM10023231_01660 [Olivibacter ginsenosidimutans]|uniref:DUF4974 domain-containing protein n=1 Tax=Olivibacter ginsenosidimutans TaxID=1176537 RepID=A0ABP9AC68_9SPHI